MARPRIAARISAALTDRTVMASCVFGVVVLVVSAADGHPGWHLAAIALFAATLASLRLLGRPLAATVREPLASRVADAQDLLSVCLVMAGTFTPFSIAAVFGRLSTAAAALAAVIFGLVAMMRAVLDFSRTIPAAAARFGMVWALLLVFRPYMEGAPSLQLTLFFGGVLLYSFEVVAAMLERKPLPSWVRAAALPLGAGGLLPLAEVLAEVF